VWHHAGALRSHPCRGRRRPTCLSFCRATLKVPPSTSLLLPRPMSRVLWTPHVRSTPLNRMPPGAHKKLCQRPSPRPEAPLLLSRSALLQYTLMAPGRTPPPVSWSPPPPLPRPPMPRPTPLPTLMLPRAPRSAGRLWPSLTTTVPGMPLPLLRTSPLLPRAAPTWSPELRLLVQGAPTLLRHMSSLQIRFRRPLLYAVMRMEPLPATPRLSLVELELCLPSSRIEARSPLPRLEPPPTRILGSPPWTRRAMPPLMKMSLLLSVAASRPESRAPVPPRPPEPGAPLLPGVTRTSSPQPQDPSLSGTPAPTARPPASELPPVLRLPSSGAPLKTLGSRPPPPAVSQLFPTSSRSLHPLLKAAPPLGLPLPKPTASSSLLRLPAPPQI
jgi:hypothetical protein